MSGKIFTERDKKLTVLEQENFPSEAQLQELIENHPEIIAGEIFTEDLIDPDQIDPDSPQWVLIREAPVDGIGRVDHLFVGQDRKLTFVEVKRGTNPDLRRKVVGQMLDYVANTTIERIKNSLDKDKLSILGITPKSEAAFWQEIDKNLQDGNVRLLFVAESIPPELQKIIEFLNEQMEYAEVLGLEIKRFQSVDGSITLIPNLVGNTTRAVRVKLAKTTRNYDGQAVLDSITDLQIKKLYTRLFDFAGENEFEERPGTKGCAVYVTNKKGQKVQLFWPYGNDNMRDPRTIIIPHNRIKGKESGINDIYKKEIERLGFFESGSGYSKWRLTSESTAEQMEKFLAVVKDVADKIREG